MTNKEKLAKLEASLSNPNIAEAQKPAIKAAIEKLKELISKEEKPEKKEKTKAMPNLKKYLSLVKKEESLTKQLKSVSSGAKFNLGKKSELEMSINTIARQQYFYYSKFSNAEQEEYEKLFGVVYEKPQNDDEDTFEVEIGSIINPDFPKTEPGQVAIAPSKVKVKTLDKAKETVEKFISSNDLGGGNFIFGDVFQNGKKIGHISYNGQFHELKEIPKKLHTLTDVRIKISEIRSNLREKSGKGNDNIDFVVETLDFNLVTLPFLLQNNVYRQIILTSYAEIEKIDVDSIAKSEKSFKDLQLEYYPQYKIGFTTGDSEAMLRLFVSQSQFNATRNNKELVNTMIELFDRIFETPIVYGSKKDAKFMLHYFNSGSDVYIKELDFGAGLQDYGFVILNGDLEMAELGYVSIQDLIKQGFELDYYYTPQTLVEIKKETKEEEKTPETKPKIDNLDDFSVKHVLKSYPNAELIAIESKIVNGEVIKYKSNLPKLSDAKIESLLKEKATIVTIYLIDEFGDARKADFTIKELLKPETKEEDEVTRFYFQDHVFIDEDNKETDVSATKEAAMLLDRIKKVGGENVDLGVNYLTFDMPIKGSKEFAKIGFLDNGGEFKIDVTLPGKDENRSAIVIYFDDYDENTEKSTPRKVQEIIDEAFDDIEEFIEENYKPSKKPADFKTPKEVVEIIEDTKLSDAKLDKIVNYYIAQVLNEFGVSETEISDIEEEVEGNILTIDIKIWKNEKVSTLRFTQQIGMRLSTSYMVINNNSFENHFVHLIPETQVESFLKKHLDELDSRSRNEIYPFAEFLKEHAETLVGEKVASKTINKITPEKKEKLKAAYKKHVSEGKRSSKPADKKTSKKGLKLTKRLKMQGVTQAMIDEVNETGEGVLVKPVKRSATGSAHDKAIKGALRPGKRLSADGNIYYEYRENMSDVTKKGL